LFRLRNGRVACYGSFASGFFQKNCSDIDLTILLDWDEELCETSLELLEKVAMLAKDSDLFSLT
jgi:predicted nucleotidyltransferase